jgi:hypothetical protein
VTPIVGSQAPSVGYQPKRQSQVEVVTQREKLDRDLGHLLVLRSRLVSHEYASMETSPVV